MSNIFRGCYSAEEVQDFLGGKEIAIAYAKDRDNPRANGYDFWNDIKHPETGETLRATKGYCNPNNMYQCYYAEYQGSDGGYYHYIDSRYCDDVRLRGTQSIQEQQYEDKQELQNKVKSQRHSDFFTRDDTNDSSETSSHRRFFESTSSSNSAEENNSTTVSNISEDKKIGSGQFQGN